LLLARQVSVAEGEAAELSVDAKAVRTLLRRLEILGFWAVAPLVALLPAKLAYGFACRRGDLISRYWPEESAVITRNLRKVLGDTLSSAEAERLTRDFLRASSCEVIDIMRLRGRTRPLGKLVEIRGREHLEAAIAEGKGALLCTAHFGSYDSAFSLIHASGFPVTAIGHWWWDYLPGVSPAARRFWDFMHGRRLLRHRQRPNIEPWGNRIMSGMQAVSALRRNEVVTICSDAFVLKSDQSHAVKVPFLGGEAKFLPGVVSLARGSGAPILMMFAYRSADYRHQVVEISPPLLLNGKPEMAFRPCAAAIEAAIRRNPALWHFWGETDYCLAELGLLPAASSPENVAVTQS
jgi:lauroyl/myristoyl acyltransferase